MLRNHQQLVHMLGNHLPTCTHAEQSQMTCTCDRNHQQLLHMLGIPSTDLYNILGNHQQLVQVLGNHQLTCTIY